MTGPSSALLVVGLVSCVFFALGVPVAVRARSISGVAAYGLSGFNAVVFSISNAHYPVPDWLFTAVTIAATPARALLLVCYLLLFLELRSERGRRRKLEHQVRDWENRSIEAKWRGPRGDR